MRVVERLLLREIEKISDPQMRATLGALKEYAEILAGRKKNPFKEIEDALGVRPGGKDDAKG